MPEPIPAAAVACFYRSALLGLRQVEARTPTGRRFGEDADALWGAFHGHLTTADRIDLLLRDAAVTWPTAFAPSRVFARPGVAEDDAFGLAWPGLAAKTAEELWCALPAPASGLAAGAARCAGAWGVTLHPLDPGPVTPSTRLIAAGPSAFVTLASVFAAGRDLSFPDQVLCVATLPNHRHLAGLMAALLNEAAPARLVSPQDASPPDFPRGARLVHGPDVQPADLAWIREQLGS